MCLLSEVDRRGKVPGVHDPDVLDCRRRRAERRRSVVETRPGTLLTTDMQNILTHNTATYRARRLRENHDVFKALSLYN